MINFPISIGLSPNIQKDDVVGAIKILFQPWKWKEGSDLKRVELWFKKRYKTDEIFLFNSGRSSLYFLLNFFGIGPGDEVIVQSFNCVAVPGPILWVGAKPVYADVDDSLNIDPGQLEKLINGNTKVIIVQHTFGIPAKIDMIKKITQKYRIILIEDCAHSLGAKVNNKEIGTFGDASFFSFGRDKVLSSVFGGAVIINSKFEIRNLKLGQKYPNLKYPSYFWIFQQLLHPIVFSLILPLYNLYLGKIILFVLIKLTLLSKPVVETEKQGLMPKCFPRKYPNALAGLLVTQLGKLDNYNRKRVETASYYFKKLKKSNRLDLPHKISGSIYLRFNILTKNAKKIMQYAQNKKIILGNWYKNVIDPIGVNFSKINYRMGDCPHAEKYARESVNLPTYPRLKKEDLDKVIDCILNYEN